MASGIPRAKYVTMSDNRQVRTAVITSEPELRLHLPEFMSGVRNSGFLVGFDTEWTHQYPDKVFYKPFTWTKVALLKLCNNSGFCLLINLPSLSGMPLLVNLLAIGDITFVGVDIHKQLDKLRQNYGLEMRSAVELTSITDGKTGDILEGIDNLWENTCGWKPKGVDEELMSWLLDDPWDKFDEYCTDKQLQNAVFSAYAAVKIAHKLLHCSSINRTRLVLRP